MRNDRQHINNILALESCKKRDLTKNINKKELTRVLDELNFTIDKLFDECQHNHTLAIVLSGRISINASRQGFKDEETQLKTINITSIKCGISIEILNKTDFRPTKSGIIISNSQFIEQGFQKNDCLKSFDAKISGKINGWIFAKVVVGNGGHQDNVFEESYTFCDWVINFGNKSDIFIVVCDTDLILKFNNFKEKYMNVDNIIIGDHITIQQYFIDKYYISCNK